MAIEALEVRMARLEGAYEQRSELTSGIDGLRSGFKAAIGDVRRRMDTQFYWLLTLVLGSILIPILRDLALTR